MRIVPASWRRGFFWAEDWLALWALVKAECDIAPPPRDAHSPEPNKPMPGSAKFLREREINRAWQQHATPSSPSHTGHRAGDHKPALRVPGTILAPKRMPTLSSWSSLTTSSLRSPTLSSSTHAPAKSRHLPNPHGRHRPLLMLSFPRRPSPTRNHVKAAAGTLQHKVACRDGANKMIKSIQYSAEADPSRVLVALDPKAAFHNVSDGPLLHTLEEHDPDLAIVFSRWYTGSNTHRMHHDGSYAHVHTPSVELIKVEHSRRAAAVEPISRLILSETHRMLDSGATLWACLDDWYIWIKSQYIQAATNQISSSTPATNFEPRPSKIQIWTA